MFQRFSSICALLKTDWANHFNEPQTCEQIIEPILECFGWDPSQTNEIVREWGPPNAKDRIDYAFFPHDEPQAPLVEYLGPMILLEAKQTYKPLHPAIDQLSRYITRPDGGRHTGIAVLTDGIKWWFCSTIGLEAVSENHFYKVDLSSADPMDSHQVLDDFLRREYWLRRVTKGAIWDAETWRLYPPVDADSL